VHFEHGTGRVDGVTLGLPSISRFIAANAPEFQAATGITGNHVPLNRASDDAGPAV